jgi:two-component system, OmpR family, response regulator MtrA
MARILLAEDEQQIGDMVAFKLTNSGHQVVRVADGEAALAAAERDRPDVIILDVMMPLVDGFAVLGRLQAKPDLRTIPVIMLTARGQERDVLSGLQAGAADYIVKPFSLKELLARVEVALRRR